MIRNAVRARSWVLDPPVPEILLTGVVNRISSVTYVWDPDQRDTVQQTIHQDVREAVPLVDGRWVFPRHAFTPLELQKLGYTVTVRDHPGPSVDVPSTIEMRDDIQRTAIDAIRRGGFLVLNPGRGKTVIFLKLVQDLKTPALVFVDDGSQFTQWRERTLQHLSIPEDQFGVCQGEFSKWTWEDRTLCVTLFQSFVPALQKGYIPPEFFERFGLVCFDEAHVSYSPTRGHLSSLFPGLRVALTATPEKDGKEEQAYLHHGPIAYEYRKGDLVPHVTAHLFDVGAPAVARGANRAYQKLMGAVLGSGKKDVNLAYLHAVKGLISSLQDRGRRIIALVPRTRFLWKLHEELESCAVIDGKTPFSIRDRRLNSTNTVLVISKIGEKAIDRKDLDTLVVTYPFGVQAATRVEQSTGRILRTMQDKADPEVYICAPDCEYGRHVLQANLRLCKDMGFSTAMRAPPRIDMRETATSSRSMY